jgi:hypothetical protein
LGWEDSWASLLVLGAIFAVNADGQRDDREEDERENGGDDVKDVQNAGQMTGNVTARCAVGRAESGGVGGGGGEGREGRRERGGKGLRELRGG